MKKWDVIIIIFLVILSILPMVLIFTNDSRYDEEEVFISVNGKGYSRFLLTDKENEIIIENDGLVNVIYIKDKNITMKQTNCPDRICAKKGEINKVGESIVCLPNKIFIEIRGVSEEDIIIAY